MEYQLRVNLSQHLLVPTLLALVGVHPVTMTVVTITRLLYLPHQHLGSQQVVIVHLKSHWLFLFVLVCHPLCHEHHRHPWIQDIRLTRIQVIRLKVVRLTRIEVIRPHTHN